MKHPTKIEDRRNWKGQTVDYEAIHDYEFRECQYCLTDAQVAVLGGVIEFLAWDTRWIGIPDGDESREWILQFRNDIQRRLMMPCGCENVIYRYTVDFVLEQSDDDGENWTPAPQDDPRNNSPQFPPMMGDDGDDKKCIAATGAAALMKAQVAAQLTDGMSSYTLQELLYDWTNQMINSGSNIFQTLLTIAANQILALGILALTAALTDPVWETMKCIMYCNMSADASFTTAQIDAITTDIGDQIGGIATLFLQQLVNLLGVVGMTNLARAGGATEGDCSACGDCVCSVADIWDDTQPGVLGNIIERGDCYVIVEAERESPTGNYFATIQTTSASICGKVMSIEAISGGITFSANWAVCGSGSITSGLFPLGTCVWICQVASDALEPLTVKFNLAAC